MNDARFCIEQKDKNLKVSIYGDGRDILFMLNRLYLENEELYSLVKGSVKLFKEFKKEQDDKK